MNKIVASCLIFPIALYAQMSVSVEKVETIGIWVALFALGIVGVLILYFSSKQIKNVEKIHQEMLRKQEEIERKQSLFLANMSENIHDIVQENYAKINASNGTSDGHKKALLDATEGLIEFLHLKSKKVVIQHEKFNINNVLNEISGTLCSQFRGIETEIIVDVDNNTPRYLIGDALHLEKVLKNLFEYTLSLVRAGEVRLEVGTYATFEEKIELQFKLSDTGMGLTSKEREELFMPSYDEETKSYQRLGLYVAKELTALMGGELEVTSLTGKGTTFVLTLPFSLEDVNEKRNYRLPKKTLTAKKVFICDSNYNAALALKKKFAYFKHDVKVVSQSSFLKRIYDLSEYDIVVLDRRLFNERTQTYLSQLKEQKRVKVIALNALWKDDESDVQIEVVDKVLSKPMNQERVFELIVGLFQVHEESEMVPDMLTQKSLEVHRGEIAVTPHITTESFKVFAGSRLLLVEDDLINQKVLLNVLKESGIDVTVANNGQEAVDTIRDTQEGFDLVLMDINMPVMDGFFATQTVRLETRFDNLPIVAFTALALESEKEKIFRSGMNACMSKPLHIGQLYTLFGMYLPSVVSDTKQEAEDEVKPSSGILDIEKGLGYANGNEAFYMEILNAFLDAYGDSAEVFAKLIAEHRYEQLRLLCVDVKGLTGSIGAKEMYALVQEIHQKLLYHQDESLAMYAELYEETLERLKIEILHYLS